MIFSESSTGKTLTVPVTVIENNHNSFTLSNVPETKMGIYMNNFYNHDDLYIDSYKYTVNEDQSAHVTFNAFNMNNIHGIVEVYNEFGKLEEAVLLKKRPDMDTGLKDLYWDAAGSAARDFVRLCDGTAVDYRQETLGTWTPVEVDIPRNGYIRITTDPLDSDLLALLNSADLLLSVLSLAGKVQKYDPDDITVIENFKMHLLKDAALDHLKEDGGSILKGIAKDIAKEGYVTAVMLGDLSETLTKLFLELDLLDALEKSMLDAGFGFGEDVLLDMIGFYGKIIETVFLVGKTKSTLYMYFDYINALHSGSIEIQNQGGAMRTSSQIKLESDVDFTAETALQAYTVTVDEALLDKVKQADTETYNMLTKGIMHTYNISLLQNGEEIQHSSDVTVYMPIPDDLQALSLAGNVNVYRIEEDGTLTNMNAVVEDGCMKFVTDHFSLYTIVGYVEQTIGDLDGNETVNEDDAIYLLQYVLMPDLFPVEQPVDYDQNGEVNEDDAIYLLQYVLMPDLFPI